MLDDTVLIDYIQDKITDIPSDGYGYVQRYLALVDTKNGNAYIIISAR